jgi:hypothetical protein
MMTERGQKPLGIAHELSSQETMDIKRRKQYWLFQKGLDQQACQLDYYGSGTVLQRLKHAVMRCYRASTRGEARGDRISC